MEEEGERGEREGGQTGSAHPPSAEQSENISTETRGLVVSVCCSTDCSVTSGTGVQRSMSAVGASAAGRTQTAAQYGGQTPILLLLHYCAWYYGNSAVF